eukprot:544755-Pyramimonas_sp.AAC.1
MIDSTPFVVLSPATRPILIPSFSTRREQHPSRTRATALCAQERCARPPGLATGVKTTPPLA